MLARSPEKLERRVRGERCLAPVAPRRSGNFASKGSRIARGSSRDKALRVANESDDALTILERYQTIAVVGMSRDPNKSAHSIPRALQNAGFRVIPVNPNAGEELLGERVYPSLAAVPEPIEVVLVFRPSEEGENVARQAVQVGARALWLQLGIRSSEAKRIAREAGLLYVEDRCIGVERALHRITKGR
jgi:predicted CoA-binding protein